MDANDLDYDSIVAIIEKAKAEEEKAEKLKQKYSLTAMLPNILSIVAFCIVVAVWLILDSINPTPKGSDWGWLTLFNVEVDPGNAFWPRKSVNTCYIMLIASMVSCVVAFIFNRYRVKNNDEKYKTSIFVIGAIVLITFVVFLVYFLPKGILGL